MKIVYKAVAPRYWVYEDGLAYESFDDLERAKASANLIKSIRPNAEIYVVDNQQGAK